ncbi:T9SS type A sorting domain-containing protein [Ferruginibacter sp.]
MRTVFSILLCFVITGPCFAQTGWKVCNSPAFTRRVDDLFMVNTQVGYAVCGDGKIVKTTDGGDNWTLVAENKMYYRSVEFINPLKGFVGGFSNISDTNVLKRTTDGGATWTDLSPLLPRKAKRGICGLAVADANTIYGCGNWYQDSGYIIKSVDGGDSWSLIDMSLYATSIIDLCFINKDVGFATGRGPLPLRSGVILYTTDGGATWTYKFQNNVASEYCWKIQRLTDKLYFASLEDLSSVSPKVLSSTDGGMTWRIHQVANTTNYDIEGIGFIDANKGWTGGGAAYSFQTNDGGVTWDTIHVCPYMNRVFKVNDTLLLASGDRIWKYKSGGYIPAIPANHYAWMKCNPNPVKDKLNINIAVSVPTRVMLMVLDNSGKQVALVENADKSAGSYQYKFDTRQLAAGIYYVVLKTHDDKVTVKVMVNR